MSGKPKTIQGYKDWLKNEHNVVISNRTKTYYESVADKLLESVKKSEYWDRIKEELKSSNDQYQIDTGYRLLEPNFEPELVVKSFDSFLLKTFRKNILENRKWPDPPHNGWLMPDNWYSSINDIVRTLFVVKYLDGVENLIDIIQKVFNEVGLRCNVHMEAREEGYYAAHIYVHTTAEIPKEDWDTKEIDFNFELQITTQLQEVIRKLLHSYYEKRRIQSKNSKGKWQWDYKSDEFSANYLGHILHYVEGMIMEIRSKEGDQ